MQKRKMTGFVQLGLGVVFMAALAAGLWRGEATDVLRKAIMICLECIGLG